MYKPIWPGTYYFKSFTFTSMGNSGSVGPADDQTYSDAPWPSSSYFSVKYGQQNWTVPANGVYQITAAGAYGANPGRIVTGQVILSQDQVVTMLVGQEPTPLTANVADNVTVGGGGGTFVVTNGAPLMVASGGDGTGGNPGAFLPSGNGDGNNGAGFYGDGAQTNPFFQFLVPRAYVNGGYGNIYQYGQPTLPEEGGFGGGQCPVGLLTAIQQITGDGVTATCQTAVPHGYPFNYIVTISGTTYYDGVQVITSTDPSVFTFTNSNTQTVSTGTVAVLTTYSGAGGYTGSSGYVGDGGATCYASSAVQNFTDLGATSNTSGFVTIGLVNPVPLVQTSTWNKIWTTSFETFVPPNSKASAVAFGAGVYVAVTNGGELPVLYSYDGVNWQKDASGAPVASWVSVTYGNGSFCAVSHDYEHMISSDGINWSYKNDSVPVSLWVSVAYLNGQFVSVSFSGAPFVMTSKTPAAAWSTASSVPLASHLASVTYGNGLFVAVGSSPSYVLTASDPAGTWTQATSPQANFWQSVIYANGLFVAVTLDSVMTATDPSGTWRLPTTTPPNGGWISVTFGNDLFVAVGTDAVMYANDPTGTWSSAPSVPTGTWISVTNEGGLFVSVGTNAVIWATDPTGTWTYATSVPSGDWKSVTNEGGLFVAVGTDAVMYSTDPTGTWSSASSVPTGDWTSVAYGDGVFVAVTENAVMTSPDGIHWTRFAPINYSAVTYGNGLFVAVANGGPRGSQYSSDGITWTNGNLLADAWSTVSYGNGVFSALTDLGSNVSAYSTDGVTWSYGPPTYSFVVPSPGIFLPYPVSTTTTGNEILISSLTYSPNVFTTGILTQSYSAVYPNEGYGWCSALSGDGRIAVIGAPNASSNVGNVYVYTDGALTQTLVGASANVMFGSSLALSDDGTVLIVGAQGTLPGYANVYNNGVLTQTLTGDDGFGWACAINASGNVFAVSALLIGFGISGGQSVYYTQGNVTTRLVGSTPSDGFGWAIGLSADGYVLAVSAYLAAYVNVYKNGSFAYKLHGSYADQFGWSLALDTHGHNLAVGAPSESSGTGSIKFYRDGVFDKTLKGPSGATEGFGWALTISRDGMYIITISRYGSNVETFSVTETVIKDSWRGSTYGSNGLFAAVSASGTTIYSQTGISWSDGGLLSFSSNCVTYGQGYFIAPSNNPSIANLAISTDCQSWANVELSSGAVFSGTTYGSPYGFVIVSPTTFEIGYSPTFFANPNNVIVSTKLNNTEWSQVAYGNGVFAVGGKGLLQGTKDIGQTWSRTFVSNTIVSVSYSRSIGTFLAFSNVFADGTYTSQDGIVWSQNTNLPLTVPSANASTVWGTDKFVALLDGDSNVFYSQDGVYWSVATQGTGKDSWKSVTWGSGQFVACPTSSNAMVSRNGIAWTTQAFVRPTIPLGPWYSIVYGNGFFVLAGLAGIATATDPKGSWTSADTVPISSWYSVTYGNGLFVAVGRSNPFAMWTNNPVGTWIASGTVPNAIWNSVTYGNGLFVAVSSNSPYVMWTGNPVGTWLTATNPLAPGWASVTYGNGLFVAVTDISPYVMWTSDPRGTWYAASAPQSGSWTSVTYANGIFVATGYSVVMTATDPRGTWTSAGSVPSGAWSSVTYGNGVFVAVQTGNTVMVATDPTGTWSLAGSSAGSWAAVTYANGLFVAASASDPFIETSPNGINWFSQLFSFTNGTSIAHGNGVYVAVSNLGNYGAAYSYDGLTWAIGFAPVDAWDSVVYGNGYFMAVSKNGLVMYSQDGINWYTDVSGVKPVGWKSVAYGDNTFLAIEGQSGSFMTTQLGETF